MLLESINGHAHNVRGELYALDEKTLLLTNFHYDGTAPGMFKLLQKIHVYTTASKVYEFSRT